MKRNEQFDNGDITHVATDIPGTITQQPCFLSSKSPAGGVIFGFSRAQRPFDCLGAYYQREQAADPAGSHTGAHATEQRKSLSGKQLMSLTLKKVSRVNPPIPACPHTRLSVCHHAPRPPAPQPPPSSRSSSWLRSPAV